MNDFGITLQRLNLQFPIRSKYGVDYTLKINLTLIEYHNWMSLPLVKQSKNSICPEIVNKMNSIIDSILKNDIAKNQTLALFLNPVHLI